MKILEITHIQDFLLSNSVFTSMTHLHNLIKGRVAELSLGMAKTYKDLNLPVLHFEINTELLVGDNVVLWELIYRYCRACGVLITLVHSSDLALNQRITVSSYEKVTLS